MEVGVRELRNNLSRFLDRVRHDEELVVTVRGRAVARVVPVVRVSTLDRLVNDGTGVAVSGTGSADGDIAISGTGHAGGTTAVGGGDLLP